MRPLPPGLRPVRYPDDNAPLPPTDPVEHATDREVAGVHNQPSARGTPRTVQDYLNVSAPIHQTHPDRMAQAHRPRHVDNPGPSITGHRQIGRHRLIVNVDAVPARRAISTTTSVHKRCF